MTVRRRRGKEPMVRVFFFFGDSVGISAASPLDGDYEDEYEEEDDDADYNAESDHIHLI